MKDLLSIDYEDFSGGMADINSPNDRTSGEIAENFDITTEKKLQVRPGSTVLDETASLVSTSAGDVREDKHIGSIINYDEDRHLILRGINRLYAKSGSSWSDGTAWSRTNTPQVGYPQLPAAKALTAAAVVSNVLWRSHVISVGRDESESPNVYISPQKTFLDENNTWQTQNASIPSPSNPYGFIGYSKCLVECINLANELKAKFNTHAADGEAHATTSTPITSPDATDEKSLITLLMELVQDYNSHALDAMTPSDDNAHGFDTEALELRYLLTLKVGLNHLVPDFVKPTSAFECAPILNRLRFAYNLHTVAFVALDVDNEDYQGEVVTFNTTTDRFSTNSDEFLRTGDEIYFSTSDTLPTPLVAGQSYFVVREKVIIPANPPRLAATLADARAGTYIDLGGSPSGTHRAYPGPQNLHPKTDPDASVIAPYIYPEGYEVTAKYVEGVGDSLPPYCQAPHYITHFANEIKGFLGLYRSHLSDGAHFHDAARGYMTSDLTLMGIASDFPGDDWQGYAAIVKLHFSFRVHRIESSGEYHFASSTEPDATELSAPWYAGTSKYVPDPFSQSTWENAYELWKDWVDKLVNTPSPTDAHYVNQFGGTRHVGTEPSIVWHRQYEYTFGAKRFALIGKVDRTLYDGTKFTDISEPNLTQSYCVVASAEVLNPLLMNGGIPPEGPVGTVFRPQYYLFAQGYFNWPHVPPIENVPADTATIEVYETVDGGTVFYLSTTYPNLQQSSPVQLSKTDDELQSLGIELYTTGGIVANGELPPAASMVRVGEFGFLLNIVEEGSPTIKAATVTPGATGKIDLADHGLAENTAVVFWSEYYPAGVIPTGLFPGVVYYVRNPSKDDFEVAYTPNGVSLGISDTGTGDLFVATKANNYHPRRVRQTHFQNLLSSPEEFFTDLESEGVFIGRAQEYPIAVCKRGVYRIEGTFADDGTGGMVAKQISERVGGLSANCGITVNDVLFFMGQDGFYMTDGFQVEAITQHLKRRHMEVVSKDQFTFSAKNTQVQCVYDSIENRIIWSVVRGNTSYPTETWVLHLASLRKGRAPMTVWNNGEHFAPTALGFFRGMVLRGDRQGFVFKHASTYKSDTKINRSGDGSVNSAVGVHIPYRYRSLPEDFGDRRLRKWVSKILAKFENRGNLTLLIRSINDQASSLIRDLKSIRFRGEYGGLIKESRTFPTSTSPGTGFQGLRCHEKQVQIEPAEEVLYRSDDYALANKGDGSVTIADGNWPSPDGSLVDFYIYFDIDNYQTGWLITGITSATELAITSGSPTANGVKWYIKGKPKDESPQIDCLTLLYEPLEAQPMPPSGESGGNA